jgi:hypothetical protein
MSRQEDVVRFQVLKAVDIETTAFWGAATFSLFKIDRSFGVHPDGGSTHL